MAWGADLSLACGGERSVWLLSLGEVAYGELTFTCVRKLIISAVDDELWRASDTAKFMATCTRWIFPLGTILLWDERVDEGSPLTGTSFHSTSRAIYNLNPQSEIGHQYTLS